MFGENVTKQVFLFGEQTLDPCTQSNCAQTEHLLL